jgi:hypothetical protein
VISPKTRGLTEKLKDQHKKKQKIKGLTQKQKNK